MRKAGIMFGAMAVDVVDVGGEEGGDLSSSTDGDGQSAMR